MQRETLKDSIEIVGVLSIIASLIFVGLEIRLSRDIAKADIFQQRTAMELDINLATLAPDELRGALLSWRSAPSAMTELERAAIRTYMIVWITAVENAHYQFELGLIPEDEWLNQRLLAVSQTGRPCFTRIWEGARGIFREAFVQEIGPLIDEADAVECPWDD